MSHRVIEPLETRRIRIGGSREGFVLPVILFSLLLMSTVALVTMTTSSDEFRSARAMRESSLAFYTAEAGFNQVLAQWEGIQSDVDSLAPADSLDLGWTTMSSGTSYRAVVHRWDDGTQAVYEVVLEGRTPSANQGSRTLSYLLTDASGAASGYTLGECCGAAMHIRGALELSSRAPAGGWKGEIDLSGLDTHPPGWEDAGACSEEKFDKPAVVMENTSLFSPELPDVSSDCDAYPGNVCPITVEGDPSGLVEDPTLTAEDFDQFGDLSWDSLRALADHTVGEWGSQEKLDGSDIYPRYNADGTCDTSHPLNWGSNNPDDPCFDYFPIILVRGEVEVKTGSYGQGLLVMDWNESTSSGTELELGRDGNYRGIVLGKGCVEVQKGFQFYGSIFVDHMYDGPSCDAAGAFVDCRGHDSSSGGQCDNTTIQYSQCAVDRALVNSGLDKWAEPSGGGSGAQQFLSRSFGEHF